MATYGVNSALLDVPSPTKDEGAELRKPHEMIVMMPRSKRVTLTGRRLYNALMQVSQARLAAIDGMPRADFMFEAPLHALLRTSGSSGEDRTAAKRYLKEMRGLEVDWESTAAGDGVKWRGFSMLSEVAIEVRGGDNWVSWSYPPTIMAALKEPTRWARIDLQLIAKLGTYSGIALYEICARYRDNPSGLTSRKPVAWWADALSQTPGAAERREWRKFKSERLTTAIEEINRETDLEVELIEHKEGRAVVEAQFSVRRRRQPIKASANEPLPIDANLVLRAESLGVREIKLDALVKEYGEAAVREKVELLERRSGNGNLRSIENAHSYLRSLLRNEGRAEDGTEELPKESVPAPAPFTAEPRSDPAVERLNQRIGEIKNEISELDPATRQAWVAQALQELSSKGLLSAVVSRRAAQGDVLHGVLGSTVVKLYGTATYGSSWDQVATALTEGASTN